MSKTGSRFEIQFARRSRSDGAIESKAQHEKSQFILELVQHSTESSLGIQSFTLGITFALLLLH